jgi:hypothetical protein
MVFKIKMEDKAAFLNRMKDTIKSSQIKDNELEDYFEVISNNPKQIEDIELILKQSPKINTIKEMKNGLTRSELKEMVRQQLKATLAEKKKADDKKNKIDEEVTTGAEMAAKQMMGAISSGDPFWTGVALVGAVATGFIAGPKVVQTIKGYYKALTQKDPNKAEKLKKTAEQEGLDVGV